MLLPNYTVEFISVSESRRLYLYQAHVQKISAGPNSTPSQSFAPIRLWMFRRASPVKPLEDKPQPTDKKCFASPMCRPRLPPEQLSHCLAYAL